LEGLTRRSVRVTFRIAADGSASASLAGSSGSGTVDAIVLRACNRWRFRPALRNGQPIASTVRLRVDIQ
jgi:protein TonB